MSWGQKQTQGTRHTCNDGRGPAFGRKTRGCARCDELLAGSAPRSWGQSDDARRAAEIRRHDCKISRCFAVCTFGDS